MPRLPRSIHGDEVYHLYNRSREGAKFLRKAADFFAFESVLTDAQARFSIRLLAYVAMPNHFHLVIWPRGGQEKAVSEFMRWLQTTHAQRWYAAHPDKFLPHRKDKRKGKRRPSPTAVFQSRFRAFPVEQAAALVALCRYVEANPQRAGLCRRAQKWEASSLNNRLARSGEDRPILAAWPEGLFPGSTRWVAQVNAPQPEAEIAAIRLSLGRGRPFGSESWTRRTAKAMDLQSTIRPFGRPRLVKKKRHYKKQKSKAKK